jgi:hypothetical protein
MDRWPISPPGRALPVPATGDQIGLRTPKDHHGARSAPDLSAEAGAEGLEPPAYGFGDAEPIGLHPWSEAPFRP